MTETKVVNEIHARRVLGYVREFLAQGDDLRRYGPTLRSHEHEGLPEGCWSIDFEGDYDWTIRFSEAHFEGKFPKIDDSVFIEPINGWLLGIYPA